LYVKKNGSIIAIESNKMAVIAIEVIGLMAKCSRAFLYSQSLIMQMFLFTISLSVALLCLTITAVANPYTKTPQRCKNKGSFADFMRCVIAENPVCRNVAKQDGTSVKVKLIPSFKEHEQCKVAPNIVDFTGKTGYKRIKLSYSLLANAGLKVGEAYVKIPGFAGRRMSAPELVEDQCQGGEPCPNAFSVRMQVKTPNTGDQLQLYFYPPDHSRYGICKNVRNNNDLKRIWTDACPSSDWQKEFRQTARLRLA